MEIPTKLEGSSNKLARFELEVFHRNVPDDVLIADLKGVATKLGKDAVSMIEQNGHGSFHSTTFVARFGSWNTALDKAGLGMTRTPMNVPQEDLFKNLEEVWTKLGRQPRYREMSRPLSRYCSSTYTNRFGKWQKALEEFVAYINALDVEFEPLTKTISCQIKQGPRSINWRLRFIVMRRDNFKCRICGKSPAIDPTIVLEVDHIKAWSKGGPTVLENLQTLCTICNGGKSDLELMDSTTIEAQNVQA